LLFFLVVVVVVQVLKAAVLKNRILKLIEVEPDLGLYTVGPVSSYILLNNSCNYIDRMVILIEK